MQACEFSAFLSETLDYKTQHQFKCITVHLFLRALSDLAHIVIRLEQKPKLLKKQNEHAQKLELTLWMWRIGIH